MKYLNRSTHLLALAAVISGCSGGGGGSTPPANPTNPITTNAPATSMPVGSNPSPVGATPIPTAPPSSSATATPTPAPAATPLAIRGKVVNHDTGAPLPNAVVYVSHALQTADTAPMAAPADGGEVATAADGTYAMTLPAQGAYPSTFFVNVYSAGKVTVHNELTVTANGVNQIRDLGLTTLSADEANWLVLLNKDRAKYGRSAVYTDETTEEIARLWVAYSAKGHYDHVCPAGDTTCPDKAAYAASQFATFTRTGENLDQTNPPSDYINSENRFMAEAANCPQPVNPDTCPYTETTGHFLNIEGKTANWFGFAEAFNGVNTLGGAPTNYFAQEISIPDKNGYSVYSTFRTVAPLPH